MTGTLFINNEGNGYGGGAYVNGPVQIKDGRFERNRALGFGGAGGLYASELHASGTEFIGNTANGSSTAWGGGAYVAAGDSDLTLDNVTFIGNTGRRAAADCIAGIRSLSLNDESFINNTPTQGSAAACRRRVHRCRAVCLIKTPAPARRRCGWLQQSAARGVPATTPGRQWRRRLCGRPAEHHQHVLHQELLAHRRRRVSNGQQRRARGQLALCAQSRL